MRRILIPTDFSENAYNAICYALNLFKDRQCSFVLLNTYTPTIPSGRFIAPMTKGTGVATVIRNASEKGLKKTLARIKANFSNPNHSFKTISSFCLLTEAVNEIVDEHDIDLIITGTKGSSGIEEVFMGSNTVRIIKGVKRCPVLTIPCNYEFRPPVEIAFATDLKRFCSPSEIQPIINLAKTFHATVRIVHVQNEIKPLTEMQQFGLQMLQKYFANVEHYVHNVSELNSVSNTLEIFSKELDVRLMALLYYQHSYTERLTREPIVKQSAFHTKVPLLVVPELGMVAANNGAIKNVSVQGHEVGVFTA